jgi:hypothetical protein
LSQNPSSSPEQIAEIAEEWPGKRDRDSRPINLEAKRPKNTRPAKLNNQESEKLRYIVVDKIKQDMKPMKYPMEK